MNLIRIQSIRERERERERKRERGRERELEGIESYYILCFVSFFLVVIHEGGRLTTILLF